MFLQWIEIWWTKETITFDGAFPGWPFVEWAEILSAAPNRVGDAFSVWVKQEWSEGLKRPLETCPVSELEDF